jgi:MFS family permease
MAIDLTFIHQRPQIISMLWSLVGFIGGCIYSFVPQMTNTNTNWRSFYLVWIFPSAISVTLAFFLVPETYFIRPAVAFNGRILAQSATEKVQIYQDWEEVPGGKSLPDIPHSSQWVRDLQFWGTTRGGWKAMWACYPQILGCFVNPLIFWVALLNAIVFGSMLSIGETYNFALSGPPYFLDIHYTALVNVAGAIGSLIAWPVSGKMIAWVSRRLAMSNAGVRDAEHYLPAFILPIIAGTTSVIIYGLAAQHKWHFMFIYVSYGLNIFTFTSLATANTLWVTEAFPRWAAPALVVLSGVSYTASFGISFSIQPWVASQGIATTNIEIGLMIAVVGLVLIPIAFWGKKLRQHIHERWGTSEMGALRPQ